MLDCCLEAEKSRSNCVDRAAARTDNQLVSAQMSSISSVPAALKPGISALHFLLTASVKSTLIKILEPLRSFARCSIAPLSFQRGSLAVMGPGRSPRPLMFPCALRPLHLHNLQLELLGQNVSDFSPLCRPRRHLLHISVPRANSSLYWI